MEKLFALLSRIEPLSESFINALKERAVFTSPPRGHILLAAAQVSTSIYFLKTGLAISYRYIKKKKHIEEFYKADTLVISPKSFFEQSPAQESIELLEGGELYIISRESVMWMIEHFVREATGLYVLPMNEYIEHSKDRIHDLQLLTAAERYEKLRQDCPALFRLVPLEQIARYLGVAPQTLGRLRRESEDY